MAGCGGGEKASRLRGSLQAPNPDCFASWLHGDVRSLIYVELCIVLNHLRLVNQRLAREFGYPPWKSQKKR